MTREQIESAIDAILEAADDDTYAGHLVANGFGGRVIYNDLLDVRGHLGQ